MDVLEYLGNISIWFMSSVIAIQYLEEVITRPGKMVVFPVKCSFSENPWVWPTDM